MGTRTSPSSDLKLKRAKEHLDALKTFIDDWVDSEPYRIAFEDDIQKQEWVVTIKTRKIALLAAASFVGDFVSCLRSALDHIAWLMAARNLPTGTKPSDALCFPIFGLNNIDAQVAIAKKTFGIPDEAIAIIKSLQPYHYGDTYKLSHLWRLNKLWNIDKHRHIAFHSEFADIQFPGLRAMFTDKKMLDSGAEVRFPLSAKPSGPDFKPLVDPQIIFGDKDEGILIDFDGLVDIYKFVSDEVIPLFQRFIA